MLRVQRDCSAAQQLRRNMKRFLFSLFWLVGDLQPALSAGLKDTPTLGSKNTPRLLSKGRLR